MSQCDSARSRDIAYASEIFRVQAGSRLHGVTVDGSDFDEIGVCIQPQECLVGLDEPFSHYRSKFFDPWHWGGGDIDRVIYSLRMWAGLAMGGSPDASLMLFAPESRWITHPSEFGEKLQSMASIFVSKRAGDRFVGHFNQAVGCLFKGSDLLEKHGINTKAAYIATRMAWQGIEYMGTGRITLPMRKHDRDFLIGMRTGSMTKAEILGTLKESEAVLIDSIEKSRLPDNPDTGAINAWLIDTYQQVWNEE